MRQNMVAVCVLLLLLVIPPLSGRSAFGGPMDELLLVIGSEKCELATQVVSSPLHIYHRFAEGYLVGASRSVLMQLRKAAVDFTIVDEHPWSDSYAAVAPHPGMKSVPSLSGTGVQVLYASDDIQLIKGSRETFSDLRESGFVCYNIEKMEIPLETIRLHLPQRFLQQARDTVIGLINRVSDSTIYNYILGLQNFGTRYWNNATRDTVARWIRARYGDLGLTDVRLDSFQYSSTLQTNVVATLPGTETPTAELIVGGHQDSYSSPTSQAPGADDNASGATAALEMARVLQIANYQPAYTMRFMGFAAEEAGLIGSDRYARAARTANRDIRAMLNFDMISWRTQTQSDRNFSVVWYTGSEAFRDLFVGVTRSYTTLNPIPTTSSRSGSDSYSFWLQNYKTVFSIEDVADFNPRYHQTGDLLQYLDIVYTREMIQAGLATLITLDQAPPAVPGLVVQDKGDGSSVYARWDSVATADWYRYKVGVGRRPGVYDTTFMRTTRTALVTGLTEGRTYYVGVSIVDLVGHEGMIAERSVKPLLVPLPPAGFSLQTLPRGAKLTWRKNQEMDLRGYSVFRAVGPAGAFMRLNTNPLVDTVYVDSLLANGTYRYYATAVDSTSNESTPSDTLQMVLTGIGSQRSDVAFSFRLYQNYPNPFNPATMITYEVATEDRVELIVFDVLGREVAKLVNRVMKPGIYTVHWDASRVTSGVYFCLLKTPGAAITKRMVLLK